MSEELTDLDIASAARVVRRRATEVKAERTSRDWSLLGVAAGLIALVVASTLRPPFTGAQNRYLVHVMARLDGGPITTDRLVRSVDPAPVFSAIVRPLLNVADTGLVLGTLWILAGAVFFGALWSINGRHVGRNRVRLLLWTAVMGLLAGPSAQGLLENVWSGFDGFTSPLGLRSYLVPQTGVALAVLGSAIAVRRQRKLRDGALPLGVAMILLAVVLGPSFAAGSIVLVLSLVSAEIWGRSKERAACVRSVARIVIVGIVLGGAAAALNRNAMSAFFGMSGDAAEILAPKHGLVPPFALLVVAALALGSVVGAGLLALYAEAEPERRVGRFFLCGGAIGGVLTLVTWLAGVPMLSLLAPWYSFAVLVPLALSYLVGRLAHLLPSELDSSPAARVGLYGAAAVAIVLSVLLGAKSWAVADSESFGVKYPKLLSALAEDRPAAVGLIPSALSDLRLAALVAVSGDKENSPIGSDEVLDWRRNNKLVDSAFGRPRDFCKQIAESDFGWAILPVRVAAVAQQGCMADWRFTVAEDGLALAFAPTKP
ncbi:MAG: hypothetical protein WBA45_00670 [Microthrixaceae bacterium]